MVANAGVKPDPFDNRPRIKPLDFGIGVEFIEIAHTEGQIGVGKQFHRLSLFHAHEQHRDVGFYRPLRKQGSKLPGRCFESLQIGNLPDSIVFGLELGLIDQLGVTHDYAAGVKVVIKGFAFAQELRRKQQVELLHTQPGISQVEAAAIAHGDCRFNHHHRVGIDTQH